MNKRRPTLDEMIATEQQEAERVLHFLAGESIDTEPLWMRGTNGKPIITYAGAVNLAELCFLKVPLGILFTSLGKTIKAFMPFGWEGSSSTSRTCPTRVAASGIANRILGCGKCEKYFAWLFPNAYCCCGRQFQHRHQLRYTLP